MADSKVSLLPEQTAPIDDDLLYLVTDVAGTPTSEMATVGTVGERIRTQGWQMIDEDRVLVTSGNITLNTTTVADVTALQITLQGALAGDVVYYDLAALVNNVAQIKAFDAYTYVGGVRTNAFGVGLGASAVPSGNNAWYCRAVAEDTNFGGRARRVLVSGDISGGNVVVGIATVGTTTTSRLLYANSNNGLQGFAQLWRPPS